MTRHPDGAGRRSAPYPDLSLASDVATPSPEVQSSQPATHCAFCGEALSPGHRLKQYCNRRCRAAASELRRLIAVATQALEELLDETLAELLPDQRTPDLVARLERLQGSFPERLATIYARAGWRR
jgi:predicted nucleic acid-binding Zn ribbon protein